MRGQELPVSGVDVVLWYIYIRANLWEIGYTSEFGPQHIFYIVYYHNRMPKL